MLHAVGFHLKAENVIFQGVHQLLVPSGELPSRDYRAQGVPAGFLSLLPAQGGPQPGGEVRHSPAVAHVLNDLQSPRNFERVDAGLLQEPHQNRTQPILDWVPPPQTHHILE